MSRGKSDRVNFKPYDQSQIELIPRTADELIPQEHMVRVVDRVIDSLDVDPLLRQYAKGGGRSRFSPLMLLKVLVYGYMTSVCSSRRLAKALRENIYFMWLSGRQQPDFRTINSFRKDRLAPVIDEVFIASVKLLADAGYVSLNTFFVDGTKVEANAGRYTFVWKRAMDKNEARLDAQLREYLSEARRIADEEDLEYGDRDLEEMGNGPIDSEFVKRAAAELSSILAQLDEKNDSSGGEVKKKMKTLAKRVSKDFIPRKKKYETTRPIFRGRNSFSKTDHDATFMRMKDDHMRNGQLKPAYNVQVGTEKGFVTTYGIYPNPTDTRTLADQLVRFEKAHGRMPKRVVGDAGYGSEENYTFLEEHGVVPYLKYGLYEQEKKRSFKRRRPYHSSRWSYDEEKDQLICPEGHPLEYEYTKTVKTDAGYLTSRRMYACGVCDACPVKDECTSSSHRKTAFSPKLRRQQGRVRKRLASRPGSRLYARRGHEVETVFAQIKSNQGFDRFQMRGNKGASVEWGLQMLGYNMKQIARVR